MKKVRPALLIALLFGVCGLSAVSPSRETRYRFALPEGYPAPPVPSDNPLTVEKVELGRHLFYDRRLSGNATQSCASCHRQELAFSDGKEVAVGSTGEHHFRNAQGLTNVAYAQSLGWADPSLTRLERQALIPMFGEKPVEMGLSGREQIMLQRLRNEPRYEALFARAFPGIENALSVARITQALASFLRTVVSYRSPYDRYVYGKEESALSTSAVRGMELFFSERLECFHCHNGFNFSDATTHALGSAAPSPLHNTGLYNVDGHGAYPAVDRGLYTLTQREIDMGRFRAPSLRNVALTAPYMHDGSIATLSEVIDHYAEGGRTVARGPNAGDGSKSQHKAAFVRGFLLSEDERSDLLAFLDSLTDRALTRDPSLADPWPTAKGSR
jgi:cytochrome c peroxidase